MSVGNLTGLFRVYNSTGADCVQFTDDRGFHRTHGNQTTSSGHDVRAEKQMFLGPATWSPRCRVRPQGQNPFRKVPSDQVPF